MVRSSRLTRHALQPNKGTSENREQRDASRIVRTIEPLILEGTSGTKAATLSRLVKEISGELDCNPDRVIAEIIRLRANGRIRVSEQVPYGKLVEYLLSPLSLWFWEPVLATLLSLVLLFASSGLALYFRFVFGGILVLFLPGYSLVGLIYSKKNDLDYLTRITLSFALSLAIATIVGLVLNFTPFGITLFAVALSLDAITIGLLLLTALRRYDCYRFARIAEAESQSSH
jgi:uncharacterized protein DUF1616